MRLVTLLAASLAAVCLSLGCAGGSPVGGSSTGGDSVRFPDWTGNVQSVAGVYSVQLDRDTLSARVMPKALRAGVANDDLYQLPISSFLRADSLAVTEVRGTATTIDLTWVFTHPFAGPTDPSAPASAANRADLGISGMVLFVVDVPIAGGHTFFDDGMDPVIVNTELVSNPDGYYQPRGVVTTSNIANTFPYQLLVDETRDAAGSRVGVSNGGDVTGNYGADGWIRAELGAAVPFDQWTGYGVLHQGQRSTDILSLDLGALSGGSEFAFDAVILAKYTDPRGGATGIEKRANRLPPASPDTSLFAYRMPHGALDVQRIVFDGEIGTGFEVDAASSSTLQFHLEDWDARATETTEADLSDEANVTKVAAGESGLPEFAVSIPDILGPSVIVDWDPATDVIDDDTVHGGDAAQDSGAPLDALFYRREIVKPAASGEVAGTYPGLARATDPESDSLSVKLDADLVPITVDAPIAQTFQSFDVELNSVTGDDSGWAKLLDPGTDKWAEATGTTIDEEGNVFVVGFFWQTIDFGGGLRTSIGGMDNFVVKYDHLGAYQWDYVWGSDSDENYRHVRTDPGGDVYLGGSFDGTTDFDGPGGLAPIPNNVREDAFIMKFSGEGAFQWVRTFGSLAGTKEAEVAKAMTVDASGVYLGGFFRSQGLKFDAADPNFWGGSVSSAFIVKLLPTGAFAWSACFDGNQHDEMRGIASDAGGLLAICSFYSDTIDFGGGPRSNTGGATSDDMDLLRLNSATGAYMHDVHFVGNDIEQPQALAASNGYVAVTGHTWSTNLDLGGGVLPHIGSSDFYWGRFDSTTLAHQYSGIKGSDAYDPGFGVAVDPTGALYISGLFQGTIDFGFGDVTPVMQDGFLYKIDPTGNPAWVHTWGGAVDFVRAQGLACDENSVVAVGTSGVGGPIDYQPGLPTFDLSADGISGSVIRDLSNGTW